MKNICSLLLILLLANAGSSRAEETNRFLVLPGQKVLLKGDSITNGFGFGNYTDPSPLRTIPGIGAILLKDNLKQPPAFEKLPNIWRGLNENGTPVTVDSLAADINGNVRAGSVNVGDWLIYEDAGPMHQGIHPAPWPWKNNFYLQYRLALRQMVHSVEDVVERRRIRFMTMFDYEPKCGKLCEWDTKLDDGYRTANDAIRDEAAELGIRVIDMNRIMDAAAAHLAAEGWGRPVGPDGIHPNVYGNFVMAVAILGELGAGIEHWSLDGLQKHFAHPASGGDVPSVWGFSKDPTDSERARLLRELQAIVVRELKASQPAHVPEVSSTSGIQRIVRHGRMLSVATRQPEGTTRPVIYEVGKLFQLDRNHGLLVASMREQGGHDFEIGNDGFVFKNVADIRPENAIPLNLFDPNYHLKSTGEPAVQGRFTASGAFVPLDAKLPDGRKHPAAGTGFLFSGTLTFKADRSEGHPGATKADRTVEFVQIKWDGTNLRVTGREFVTEFAGVGVGRVGLNNCAAQGKAFLCPFGADDGSYIAVIRFEWAGGKWKASAAGKPFLSAPLPQKVTKTRVYRWLETESSLLFNGKNYVLYTRGYDWKGRVYTSADGLNYTPVFSHYNHNTPQSLNLGLDGSMYLATNRGPSLLRSPLLAFPLQEQQFMEPLVIHDEKRVTEYPAPESPFVDHGVGANIFLEGRWRHFFTYRLCELNETNGRGAAPGPHTGLYLSEMEYGRVTRPSFGY